eukprot:CAMPEP_0114442780 /NCGR_PEP_ID=MMETSP0103-20121206/17146_1 /TAXON_ID=37642 ORGANISM="Paraphysomonas imperforata, Strain PA2" /NCGR_SAMPLE_ID=MMETSP0103 /ASSEMBLY_ACC=CAM_ASM_000201 /LENGTH=193 /DNA_ID=CAMNT_0001614095 /DNA_START=26 /DNA_END=607 /DNA_ORIENTATION=-
MNTSLSSSGTGSIPSPECAQGVTAISRASLLSMSRVPPSLQSFTDIDLQVPASHSSVVSVLQGSTQPSVSWTRAFDRPLSDSFPQYTLGTAEPIPLPPSRHGTTTSTANSGALAHVSAVCFTSPYAAAILQLAVMKATVAMQAGAYAYWLNCDNLISCSDAQGDSDVSSIVGQLPHTEQIKLSLHFLQQYLEM